MVQLENNSRKYWLTGADVKTTAKTFDLAISQTHHSMEGRPIVREATFDEWKIDPAAGNALKKEHEEHAHTLYPEVEFKGHHWGMAVDLTSCTGCSNCSVSCQAENNIPVIGKEQVRNRRIMHWIRIDRYYSNNAENPEVFHQPVMCQHCDNAPCENVCPVSATPHSEEGLNQMAYNRCVGTKYCINNCPYKVRRFNWFQYVKNDEFDFASNSDLGRMVLNPDVTVRSRGVVEKCSFCVQRIQEKKAEAKVAGRKLSDGEVQPACVQSCPANALVFGDMNDPESKISKYLKNERNYHLLEELHTLPSVGYLTKIRNIKA
jgi:molybdopterin-containing oxidoreductase family iron-sulfur binding subunit